MTIDFDDLLPAHGDDCALSGREQTDAVIEWFVGTTEGQVEAELLYKNGASAPHQPPFSPEKVADWVGSMAEMWSTSIEAAEVRLFDLVDLTAVDWNQVGRAIRDWYRDPDGIGP